MDCRNRLHCAEALLHRFDEHLTHGLARQPLPSQARHAMTLRSRQSLAKVAVTVWPESHKISRPSEHQRRSLLVTDTVPKRAASDPPLQRRASGRACCRR
jgi:hypothetical protein